MKHFFTFILVFVFAYTTQAQLMIESFDNSVEESGYELGTFQSNEFSSITRSQNTSTVYEGNAALQLDYSIRSLESWGSSATVAMLLPSDREYLDFSAYDSISFMIYNEAKSSEPGRASLQFILYDKSEFAPAENRREFWWAFSVPFDMEPGWNSITIPLEDVGPSAQSNPESGFWIRSTSGNPGNGKLDLDKISGVGFSVSLDGTVDSKDVTGTFLIDNLMLVGEKTKKSGYLIESFDNSFEEIGYELGTFQSNEFSSITRSQNTSTVYEGNAALQLDYSIRSLESWGSSATVAMLLPSDREYLDFSAYDSISFMIYNEAKSSEPGRASLQFILYDKSEFAPAENRREFWWAFSVPFDMEPGWNSITIPLEDVGPSAQSNPESGFWIRSTSGNPGNGKLDLDKISGVGFSVSLDGTVDSKDVTGTFLIDNLMLVGEKTVTDIQTVETSPNMAGLKQNYPNPFKGVTQIQFSIPTQQRVTLTVFSASGHIVNVNSQTFPEGTHSVTFNATDLTPGIYYYRVQAGALNQTKKMLLLR